MADDTQDQISECIARLVGEGYDRDQAAAIAYEGERRKAAEAGLAPPSRAAFLRAARKVARTGRSKDYLETALSAAREKLHPRDFAVIHQAARARAGGLASARMRTSTEKALALGVRTLTERELDEAMFRADEMAFSDARLGVDCGGERLAEMFWAEKARRASVSKSEPGPSDVHVDKPIGEEANKDKLSGGEGDSAKPKDVDQDELKRGIAHEMEHTDDPKIAQEIALDHLTEDPAYYTKLEAIELSSKSEAQDLLARVIDVDNDSCTVAVGDDLEFTSVVSKGDVDVEPGDTVVLDVDMTGEMSIKSGSPITSTLTREEFESCLVAKKDALRHETVVPFVGPDDARVVFVSGAPNELELARGEALVGPDGEAFSERYLAPLGLQRSDVVVGFACPVMPRVPAHEIGASQTDPWKKHVVNELSRWPDAAVVAVGKAASDALGDRALLWLPHPVAARLNEDRYAQQIDRKVKRIRKALEDGFVVAGSPRAGELDILAGRIGETLKGGHGRALARVMKASREKQIVYGVVLDPYEVDTQTEWVPPSEVESTAHEYLRKSRVLGREHMRKDNAELVESWCVHYPSPEDYRLAMSLLAHKAYVMPFGEDRVHSGAWVAGVRLSDEAWAAYKRGEITGFSIGGFSHKTTVQRSAMPKVEFVQLKEDSAR